MKIIGLTGKTGSGKSSAAEFFRQKGACVADCDKIAHGVLEEAEVKEKLREAFSEIIFDADGKVIRRELAKIVFSDAEKLKVLNNITHPVINGRVLEVLEKSGAVLGVIDGSELAASGIDKKCFRILVIKADDSVRLERIMKRDGIDENAALSRMKAQCDYSGEAIVIENNTTVSHLFEKLEIIYEDIMEED